MGPMAGVRVIDMSQVISGPMAAAWLADQGAEVIKIEDAGGDPARTIGPRKADVSALFFAVNRGKTGRVVDLKSDDGKREVRDLIASADVFLQNFRPGVAERLGFGYEAVAAIRPDIVYCSISGFGDSGPRAKSRAYDGVVQAVAGVAACQSGPSGDPELVRSYICDKTTSLIAAQAITAALFARGRTGKGQKVDVNMFDAAVAFVWPEGMWNHAFLDDAPEQQPEVSAGYRLWPTKDGHIALSSLQQVEFEAMTRAMGIPEVARDPRFSSIAERMKNRDVFQAIAEKALAQWPTLELERRLAAEDAPGGRVNTRASLVEEPQAAANGTFLEIDAGELGRMRAPRHPARFSGTPTATPGPAPRLKK